MPSTKLKRRTSDPFFAGYSRVDLKKVTTFGTTVWTKDEGYGVIIVFPTGEKLKYAEKAQAQPPPPSSGRKRQSYAKVLSLMEWVK